MSKQIVNTIEIARKSLSDTVREHDWGYKVTSGQSGKEYRVFPLQDGGLACTCAWGENRPDEDQKSACHHVMAVVRHIAAKYGDRAYFCSDRHAPQVYSLGDGVTVVIE